MPYIGNITSDFSVDTGNITNRAVTALKLSPSSVGSNGQVLSVDGSGNLQWSADANAPEGTAVLSTGESGTTKFLRVDGDGTCSWQVPPNTQLSFSNDSNNRVVTGTGSGLNGEANLTFDGSLLTVTGNSLFAGQIQFSGLTTALTNISQPIITRSGSDQGSYPFDSFGHLILQSRGDGTNKDIIFATGTNGANKSIIKASGTISLGGTTQVRVGNALELYNGFDNKQARIQNSAGSNYANLLFKVNHNGTEATPFSLHPDSTADFTSNVGFGTSSPDARITVDATSNPTISIKASGTKRVTLAADTGNTEGVLASYDGYPLKFSSSAGGGTNIVMTLLNDGFIGLGTASPRRHLHIHNSASATVGMMLTNGNTGEANDSQGFQFKVGSDSHAEIAQLEDSYIQILTDGDNAMRITNDQKVGIGTTNPAVSLEVEKTIDVAWSAANSIVVANNLLRLENPSENNSAFAGMQFRTGDGGDAHFGSYQNSSSSNDCTFYWSNQTDSGAKTLATLDTASGDLTINDGDLVIGTSGHGIDFGVTSDAPISPSSEIFDDYEEGTWAPTLHDSSGNNSSFATVTNANYTRIGDTVRLSLRAVNMLTSGMTSGNAVFVKGLPYNTSQYNYGTAWLRGFSDSVWGPDACLAFAICDNNQIFFQGDNGNTGGAIFTWNDVVNNQTDCWFTIIYKTS